MAAHVIINSLKSGKQYRIDNFLSYMIESNIYIPADMFVFFLSNYEGQVSNAISAGDEVFFYVDNKLALNGLIDDFNLTYDSNSDEVEIVGRDKSSILLDNDAIPGNLYKMGLKSYLDKKVKPYGITKFEVSDNSPFDKIVISPGDSEWSIIEKLSKDRGLIPRFEIDTLVCSKLRTDTNMDYHFSNDIPGCIKFKKLGISISADVKDEVLVYGGNYSRGKDQKADKNIKSEAKKDKKTANKSSSKSKEKEQSTLKDKIGDNTLKISKRRVLNNDNLENNAEAEKLAKEELKNANKNAFKIELEFHTALPIFTNKIAKVSVKRLGLECFMLVESVKYIKDNDSGSMTQVSLKLIEGVQVNWKNHNIPLIPK